MNRTVPVVISMSVTNNPEWKKAGFALCAAVLFFLLCILSYTSIDGMSGGYALSFIAFFLTLSGIAVSLLFAHRARVMDAILSDPRLLAHWTYPEAVAQESAHREFQEYRERNRAMFIVIGGMLVLVALFFIIFIGEGGPETGVFLLLFAAFLFVVSRVTPWLEHKRAVAASRDAFISHAGIIYQGRVYPFRTFLVSRPEVSFRKAQKGAPAAIVFSFVQLVGTIMQPFDVAIPVPAGKEEDAKRIILALGGDGEL
ncbi:MAG: hypothetical protein GYA23_03630 [Methanomicrobiales archaeon]|nr:hypothetical protein [Methanomicrobiales archaeon]